MLRNGYNNIILVTNVMILEFSSARFIRLSLSYTFIILSFFNMS